MTASSLPSDSIVNWGASQAAREIAAGRVSSRDVTQAFIERIEAVDGRLNAVVVKRFDEALKEAAALDEKQARGEMLGPLHGVGVDLNVVEFDHSGCGGPLKSPKYRLHSGY